MSRHCVVVFTSIGMLLAMYAGVTPQNATEAGVSFNGKTISILIGGGVGEPMLP